MRMVRVFIPMFLAMTSCLCQEDELHTGVQMKMEITGTAQGGTVSIGATGGTQEQVITINTLTGETPAMIATKLANASLPSKPDAPFQVLVGDPSSTILITNQFPGGVYFRTSDPGLETVPAISNLRASADKDTKAVTLSWTLPNPSPNRIIIYRNGKGIADLSGDSTTYLDKRFVFEFGALRYHFVCATHLDDSGTPLRFSDVITVDSDNPMTMRDNVFRIEDATVSPAVLNKDYKLVLYKNAGTNPVAWSISSGFLPSGLAISTHGSDGQITGKPTAVGTFTFTVKVTDATGATATKELSITVQEYPTLTKVENE